MSGCRRDYRRTERPEQPALEAPNAEDRLDASTWSCRPEADPSLGLDAEDAEIVDAGYTDPRTRKHNPWVPATTPPGGRSPLSGQLSPVPNALGMSTPPDANGLMTLDAAVSAAAELTRQARQREAARIRNARRR